MKIIALCEESFERPMQHQTNFTFIRHEKHLI